VRFRDHDGDQREWAGMHIFFARARGALAVVPWALVVWVASGCGGRTLLDGDPSADAVGVDGGAFGGNATSEGPSTNDQADADIATDGGASSDPGTTGTGPTSSGPPSPGGMQNGPKGTGTATAADAGIVAAADAASATDAATSGGTGTTEGAIACGATSCSASQACCVNVPPRGAPQAACVASPASCRGDLTLSCSSRAACGAGQVCCVDLGAPSLAAACSSTCGRDPAGAVELCTSDGECPAGWRCEDTRLGLVKVCARLPPPFPH
jgi:hypothetical protein